MAVLVPTEVNLGVAPPEYASARSGPPLRLILGGSLKGEDFGPFARELRSRVRRAYLIGEAAEELARALDAASVPFDPCADPPRWSASRR